MTNITVKSIGTVAEYNSNFGDTGTFKNISVTDWHVFRTFQGRNDGKELGYQYDKQLKIIGCLKNFFNFKLKLF